MSAAPDFPKLFREYYNIHESIDALLKEGVAPDPDEVERQLRERHPEIKMEPATLAAAIKAALANTP